MVFLVKNFENLKQKEWSFCGFVQKIQNIVIFCPFWLVLVKNSNIHKDFVCFPFPCPLPAKMVSGFCKAKSKRKWTNRQMCGINSHLLFYFENLCKERKNSFSLNNFSWFFQEKTFFETWPYFLWKCVSYLLKQFAIQSACPRRNFFKPKWRNLCFKTIKSGSNLHFQANLQCFISLILFLKHKQF